MKKVFSAILLLLTIASVDLKADNIIYTWKVENSTISEAGGSSKYGGNDTYELSFIKVTNSNFKEVTYNALKFLSSEDNRKVLEVKLDNGKIAKGDTIEVIGFRYTPNKGKESSLSIKVNDVEMQSKSEPSFSNIYFDVDDQEFIESSNDNFDTKNYVLTSEAEADGFSIALTENSTSALYVLSISVHKYVEKPEFTYTSITEGSKIAGLSKGDVISFTTNFDSDCDLFLVKLFDNQKKTYISDASNDISKMQNGTWNYVSPVDISFIKDRKYTWVFEGCTGTATHPVIVNTLELSFIGDGEEATSEVSYSSVLPKDGVEFTSLEQRDIKVTFSGTAKIDEEKTVIKNEDGSSVPFETIKSSDNGTVWTLTIPESILSTCRNSFSVDITANDEEGLAIMDADKETKTLTYICYLGAPNVSVSPSADEVNELKEIKDFIYSYDGEIELVDDNSDNRICLYNRDKSKIIYKYQTQIGTGNVLKSMKDEPVTIGGIYYLHIPAGKFLLDENKRPNSELWIKYEIPAGSLPGIVDSVDPKSTDSLDALSSITVKFKVTTHISNMQGTRPYIADANDIKVAPLATQNINDNTISFTVRDINNVKNASITAKGTYKLVFPEKSLWLGGPVDGYYSTEEYGIIFNINGSQEKEIIVTSTPIDNKDVESLSKITIEFPNNGNADIALGTIDNPYLEKDGIKICEGKLSGGAKWNTLDVILDSEITDKGEYLLTIPANSIRLDGNNIYTKPIVLHYTIGNPSGISEVMNEHYFSTSYDLSGRRIQNASRPGLYIINGKKFIKK